MSKGQDSEPLEGRIAPGMFPGVLRRLYLDRHTGMLQLSYDKARCSVCFIEGRIAWGQTSIPECQLGAVVVRHGLVAQEALDQVVDLVGGGKRLGDLLIELGSLDRATLDEALALQVRETLLAAFAWLEGSWRFEESPPERFKGYDQALRISTGDLILDAVWSVTDPDLVRYALGNLDLPLALTTDPMRRYQRVTMTPADGLLLSHVDGLRTAREVLTLMPADAPEAERCLLGLLCTGIIEPAPPPAAARAREEPLTREEVEREFASLASRDHLQVLRLPSAASEKDAAAAWIRLARRFHPDSQTDPELLGLRPELEAIVARLGLAAGVLTDPSRRSAYESALIIARLGEAPEEAPAEAAPPVPAVAGPVDFQQNEGALAQAEAEFAEGRYWDALQAVEAVFEDLQPRQRLRARFLKARVYAKNPKWIKEAEEELKQIVGAEPANAEAYFLLGQVYKAVGVGVRAAAMFRRVIELKPRHVGALAELKGAGKVPSAKS